MLYYKMTDLFKHYFGKNYDKAQKILTKKISRLKQHPYADMTKFNCEGDVTNISMASVAVIFRVKKTNS